MDRRKRNILVGVLMVLSLVSALAAAAVLVANKLYDPKDHYRVRYTESVSGLEIGTTVRMKGVNVGQIGKVEIDSTGTGVIVTLNLTPGTPITEDTRATLTPLGITGLKYIELSGGTARSKRTPPNTERSIIRRGESVLKELMQRGRKIVVKADMLKDNLDRIASRANRARLDRVKHSSAELFATLSQLQKGNARRTRRITRNIDRVTRAMQRAEQALRRLKGTVDQEMPGARRAALAAVRSLEKAVSELRLEAAERSLDRTAATIRRRGATLSLDGASATFAAAAQRLERVSQQLGSSISRTDTKWSEVKKNLRDAGRFIKQLKDRYAR